MKHRIGSIVFGLAVGVVVASYSYQWITSPAQRAEREEQERIVSVARELLTERLQLSELEIVDALAPRRQVGKTYVFPVDDGWEMSGYYRRDERDDWHPYLIRVAQDGVLLQLKVQDDDPNLRRMARGDPRFEAVP